MMEVVMFACVYSGALSGVDASPIEVEVDCLGGLGQITIVGLPDAAIREACERVRSAIKSCSFLMPPGKKWVVNLAPCDVRKEGSAYDLPIATGILVSTGLIPAEQIATLWFVGELSLSGAVRPVSGILPIALACREAGANGIVVPEGNAEEAALVDGLKVYPVSHLMQVMQLAQNLNSGTVFEGKRREHYLSASLFRANGLDLKEVKGQAHAKRAMEIAAAGRHNLLMVGSPGSGKSMLAERLPGILPPLSYDEAIELTKLFSVAGLLGQKSSIVTDRPFRSPHHSASVVGLVGGGSVPKPGEISLSHLGVLFLDELTEFPRTHLDNLRQPLETQKVTISRAGQTLTYPASFILVAACNPCPCGYLGDPVKSCVCAPSQSLRYWSRLSGPLLDRIDLKVEVARLSETEMAGLTEEESSAAIRQRVLKAVERQSYRNLDRSSTDQFVFNGLLGSRALALHCPLCLEGRKLLAKAVNQYGLSARAHDRILRIARTIADLEGEEDISLAHLAEALRYRLPPRLGR
jgi:magnesium chelatase family protein